MVEKGRGFRGHGTLKLGVSHKWYDELNRLIEWYLYMRLMDIHWSYQNLLFWAGIVWHRLSVNQIVRCFKLKKLKNYMRYQVDFLLPLKLQKIYYFWLCRKILLANQFFINSSTTSVSALITSSTSPSSTFLTSKWSSFSIF